MEEGGSSSRPPRPERSNNDYAVYMHDFFSKVEQNPEDYPDLKEESIVEIVEAGERSWKEASLIEKQGLAFKAIERKNDYLLEMDKHIAFEKAEKAETEKVRGVGPSNKRSRIFRGACCFRN